MAGAVTTDVDDDEGEGDVATVPPALLGGLVTDGEGEQPSSATVATAHAADRARRLDTTEV